MRTSARCEPSYSETMAACTKACESSPETKSRMRLLVIFMSFKMLTLTPMDIGEALNRVYRISGNECRCPSYLQPRSFRYAMFLTPNRLID